MLRDAATLASENTRTEKQPVHGQHGAGQDAVGEGHTSRDRFADESRQYGSENLREASAWGGVGRDFGPDAVAKGDTRRLRTPRMGEALYSLFKFDKADKRARRDLLCAISRVFEASDANVLLRGLSREVRALNACARSMTSAWPARHTQEPKNARTHLLIGAARYLATQMHVVDASRRADDEEQASCAVRDFANAAAVYMTGADPLPQMAVAIVGRTVPADLETLATDGDHPSVHGKLKILLEGIATMVVETASVGVGTEPAPFARYRACRTKTNDLIQELWCEVVENKQPADACVDEALLRFTALVTAQFPTEAGECGLNATGEEPAGDGAGEAMGQQGPAATTGLLAMILAGNRKAGDRGQASLFGKRALLLETDARDGAETARSHRQSREAPRTKAASVGRTTEAQTHKDAPEQRPQRWHRN